MGTFPESYMSAMVSGAGMGGLVPSLANIAIIALSKDMQMAGFYALLFAEIFIGLCFSERRICLLIEGHFSGFTIVISVQFPLSWFREVHTTDFIPAIFKRKLLKG